MGYLANFIVYTLAMVGVIVFALLVFKKSTTISGVKSSKYLKVIDTMSLAPRKTLYIVSAGSEKFLIAGDVDKTTLISKLENHSDKIVSVSKEDDTKDVVTTTFKDTMTALKKPDYMDRSIGITKSILSEKNSGNSVMRNLADIMRK